MKNKKFNLHSLSKSIFEQNDDTKQNFLKKKHEK